MKIETKYNIGDTISYRIWRKTRKNNEVKHVPVIIEGKIEAIRTNTRRFHGGETSQWIKYVTSYNNKEYETEEDQVVLVKKGS